MKANDIIDVAIEYSGRAIIIEMPNGDQVTTTGYAHGSNKKGEPVLIIRAGKKLKK